MRDRLVTFGLALAALALFYVLLFPKVGERPDGIRHPLSTEPTAPGYLGMVRWLAAEHVPTLAWRQRFEKLLAATELPRAGNLLITTMPHELPMRAAEYQALDRWVQRGNTLLVVAALADTPKWSAAADAEFLGQLSRLARLKIEVVKPDKDAPAPSLSAIAGQVLEPVRVTVVPVAGGGARWLFDGVDSLVSRSDLAASRWRATPMDITPVLELAQRADNGDGALWWKPFGRGTMLISAFASPFANGAIGEGGNARFLSNLFAHVLGPGGVVLFDDAHQNVVDYYDPKKFFADPRLHRTLWWIVLGWFLLVLGARPLAIARGGPPRLDDTAMLRLTARFYAATLSATTVGRRLIAHFFNRIRRRLGLRETGQPVWEWLESQARVPREVLAELRKLYARLEAGRSVNLGRLQTLIAAIAGRIA